jgi:hypothetical protein
MKTYIYICVCVYIYICNIHIYIYTYIYICICPAAFQWQDYIPNVVVLRRVLRVAVGAGPTRTTIALVLLPRRRIGASGHDAAVAAAVAVAAVSRLSLAAVESWMLEPVCWQYKLLLYSDPHTKNVETCQVL